MGEYYIERGNVQFYIVNLSKLNPLVKLFIHLWPASLPQREDSPPLSINLLSKMWPASLRPRENVPPLSINSLSSRKALVLLISFSGACYYLSSTINPFLYSLLSVRFRRGFQDVLRRCSGRMPVGIGLVQGTIQDFFFELAMKPHLHLKTRSDKKCINSVDSLSS